MGAQGLRAGTLDGGEALGPTGDRQPRLNSSQAPSSSPTLGAEGGCGRVWGGPEGVVGLGRRSHSWGVPPRMSPFSCRLWSGGRLTMKRLSLLFTRFFSEASGVWGAPGGTVGPECGHGHSHTSPEACSPPRPPALPGALAPSVPRGASSSSPLSSPLVSPRCSQPTGTSTGFSRSCERVAGWSGIVGDANRAGGQPWSTASSPPPGTHQPADDPPDSPGPLLDGGLLVRLQQELVTRHSAELAGVAAGWGGGDRDPWGPLQRPGGPRHSRGGALLPPQWGAPGVPLTQGVSLCPPPPPQGVYEWHPFIPFWGFLYMLGCGVPFSMGCI